MCCHKSLWWKFVQNSTFGFGCNGAICYGSHSEATSKLQENQTTFAISCCCGRQGYLIVLPRDGDDHLKHRWWWFYDLPVGHISGLLWLNTKCYVLQKVRSGSDKILINLTKSYHIQPIWTDEVGWMVGWHREAAHWVVFTSYWTGSVPPERSSCSAAWREGKETGRGRGQKQKCLKVVEVVWTLNTWDSLEVRPGEDAWNYNWYICS